jgi:acyl-phosphate glycerol 3-phosphate acyltransferase
MPEALFSSAHFLNLATAAGLAYLVGGIPFGLLIGYLVSGKDVRTFGSGNIGATNVGRFLGFQWFVVVFLLDLLKGAIPVLVATFWQRWEHGRPSLLYVPEAAALAAVLGHVFPLYLGFKGGKGVATSAGALLALAWQPMLASMAAFFVVFGLTRFVSAGSLAAAAAFATAYFWLTPDPWVLALRARTVLAVAAPLLVVVAHRGNIVRLLQGREHRIGGKKPAE